MLPYTAKKKFSYDVISMTLSLLRHQTNVTDFSILGPSQLKFLATTLPSSKKYINPLKLAIVGFIKIVFVKLW